MKLLVFYLIRVAKNGVSVGDLGVKLLEKIEELTLYVIELKKENEELKSEIKNIVSQIYPVKYCFAINL